MSNKLNSYHKIGSVDFYINLPTVKTLNFLPIYYIDTKL